MRIDPAEKRATIQRLKEMIGRGRVPATPRKGFTKKEREAIFAAYEGKCADCGMSCTNRPWDGDHITQIWRGGKHALSNWQLLCSGPGSCHDAKTRREATENARIRRLEDIELNGKQSEYRWPKQKLQGRGFSHDPTMVRGVNGKVRSRA